ncbi:MAG: 3-deoxy-7-phosphoheptulonate synthase class II [Rhodothermales bacterium]|nr:3-deoxy-7-phosphoheptulonate synthase class II [Rhodothermales bacterium]
MSQQPTDTWNPASWRNKKARQIPVYDDDSTTEGVTDRLRSFPPLVSSWEVERLKTRLAEAAAGHRFVLQGGECAESLEATSEEIITGRLKLLLQMSVVLIYGLHMPVIRIGRFAGQFAKPRSSDSETIDGISLPSYRGDIINGSEFSKISRRPDPERMIRAYNHSAMTLNFVRALTSGGFADLQHPEYWDLDFLQHSPFEENYRGIVSSIDDAIRFLETVSEAPVTGTDSVQFYTSHEALLLPYEEALTRSVEYGPGIYNLSTHFPWIGLRTSEPEGAHIEYIRGLANPVAVKVGPDMDASTIKSIVRTVNPHNEPGRLTLITRMGVERIENELPALISAVNRTGFSVLWLCDPMHGNTETTELGVKTRRFENIVGELELAFDIHKASSNVLGGVHFELTADNVTECMGGARGLSEQDLQRKYTSRVDPRLNGEQALELAFRIVTKRKGDDT